MNASPSPGSGSTSSDRTEKKSWKEKRGATRWHPKHEAGDTAPSDGAVLSRRHDSFLDRLRGDQRSSGSLAAALAAVCADPRLISRLVAALDADEAVVRRRAADMLEKATRNNPEWLTPYRDALLTRALAGDAQAEVMCRLITIIPRLEPSGHNLRNVTRNLFGLIDGTGPTVQVCALQALYDLSPGRPRLAARVRKALERKLGEGAPSVRARARRLLTESSQSRRRPRRRR